MICNKCGIDGNFIWDDTYIMEILENTDLYDLNMERPHDCSQE